MRREVGRNNRTENVHQNNQAVADLNPSVSTLHLRPTPDGISTYSKQ